MYQTNYEKTLDFWKKNLENLKNNNFKGFTTSFKVYYRDTYWNSFYITLEKNYIIAAPFATALQFTSILKLLKEINFNNIIIDVRNFNMEMIKGHFVDKKDAKKIIISRKKYTSTNGSNMSIINLDLSKVKLKDLK